MSKKAKKPIEKELILFQVPMKVKNKLVKHCVKLDLPLSALMRMLISDYLEEIKG